jgi:hypothetical protein
MATTNDLLGLGPGLEGMARRREFRDQLAQEMREHWLGTLVNCELGRNQDGVFWLLTINHPTLGAHPVVVRLGDLEPYSRDALKFVLDRVTRWVFQEQ